MNRLYKIEGLVEKVLKQYPESRSDDFVLICRVYQEINEDCVIRELFFHVMLEHKTYGLPSFSSITRARRKLQNQYPELRPKKEVQKLRDKEEMNYFEYAVGCYGNSFSKFVDSME